RAVDRLEVADDAEQEEHQREEDDEAGGDPDAEPAPHREHRPDGTGDGGHRPPPQQWPALGPSRRLAMQAGSCWVISTWARRLPVSPLRAVSRASPVSSRWLISLTSLSTLRAVSSSPAREAL